MAKTYVLDTNVLLHDPAALFAFGDHRVVIPFAVIEEIDNQKKRQDEIGRNARMISRQLDDMRFIGRLSEGIPMPNNGMLYVERFKQVDIAGHVTLAKGERSEVAELGARLL